MPHLVYDGTSQSFANIFSAIMDHCNQKPNNDISYSSRSGIFILNGKKIAAGARIGFDGPTAGILPADTDGAEIKSPAT